jgi:hypothetical protein
MSPRTGHRPWVTWVTWVTWLARRLADPAVLTIVATVFLVSAAGQGLAQAYLHDESVAVVAAFSIAGSLFLAAAIVVAARRHDGAANTAPPRP